MRSEKSAGGGIGIGTITMIILVIIKATEAGLANWSWFAVISSIIWVPLGIVLAVIIVMGLIALLSLIFK